MAFTPDPYLFNNAAMGGLRTGSALADIFQQRQNRSRLQEIAQQVQQGNFNDAGAGLIGMGQVGQGIQAVNIPYNRDQQALQREFQNQQAEYQRMNSDRSYGLQERGFNADQAYRQQQLELAAQKAAQDQGGGYTTPIQAVDEQGNPVFIQANDRGQVNPVQGFRPLNPIKTVDLGTEIVTVDSRTNEVIDRKAKDSYTPAKDKAIGAAEGKTQAEASEEFSRVSSKLPGLADVVTQLDALANEATYTTAGQLRDTFRTQAGMSPTPGAVARTKYEALVNSVVLPLLRDTFGAAFTVKEGETLKASLGDVNKSPAEKKQILASFVQQKIRDAKALAERSGKAFDVGKIEAMLPVDMRTQLTQGVTPDNAIVRPVEPNIDELLKKYGG